MDLNYAAPWHRISYDNFISVSLPHLLAERLPLSGYQVQEVGPYELNIEITISNESGHTTSSFTGIPRVDEDGYFKFNGWLGVVHPVASEEELDRAEISCVGEQLYAYIDQKLSRSPATLPWDENLLRAWCPLNTWIAEFVESQGHWLRNVLQRWPGDPAAPENLPAVALPNWLESKSILRRLVVKDRQRVFTPGHIGRVCPFETPEGPNIGKILHIALGAQIQDGRLIIQDTQPARALGLEAAMIPCLEHDDVYRLLMGANMLRQWLTPGHSEPALVQSGNEPPGVPSFWCGRNLLTAFVSFGEATFEDGIVISQTCAAKLAYPYPVEPGDKFSNRHGTKGVISKILPDAEMPHLSDGTPVELVFNFNGLITRMNFGQIREALIGRLAQAQGQPRIVPPFQAPSQDELKQGLTEAGLLPDGLEQLTDGKNGPELEGRSMVGYIYWGKLFHTAREKLSVYVPEIEIGADRQLEGFYQGQMEYFALRQGQFFETIREQFNTRAVARSDSATLSLRLSQDQIEQALPPSPKFAALTGRLAAAGIRMAMDEARGLSFKIQAPGPETGLPLLKLASPVLHPWLGEIKLENVGILKELPAYQKLESANNRLDRILKSGAPQTLRQQAFQQLETALRDYCEALVPGEAVQFGGNVSFSGRAVAAPGEGLSLEQVGLPDEMAWKLFGPQVVREFGGDVAARNEVEQRSERATHALDRIMAEAWVIIYRYPALSPTSYVAFHPVRRPERVIRLHPLVCWTFLQADFDGDMVAVFLPVTAAGQAEASQKLSVSGHLERDPELFKALSPRLDMVWGLAWLSLREEGRAEIERLLGQEVEFEEGIVTKNSLTRAIEQIARRSGTLITPAILERLMVLGFEVARQSGASISPFFGESIVSPASPEGNNVEDWAEYIEKTRAGLAERYDYVNSDLGTQLLSVKSGSRGLARHLIYLGAARGSVRFPLAEDPNLDPAQFISPELIGPYHEVIDRGGQPVLVKHSLAQGLEPEETLAVAISGWEGWASQNHHVSQLESHLLSDQQAKGFHVLERAMRSARPGLVFALAAYKGEVDPLTGLESRLFVGLGVERLVTNP
ncbi:MAG: hypothetical protein J0I20_23680 [Chloroflexi bacterium]|nr:hypothetical protein [Chloroflexota bacterium]OJW04138.1 MAG: hypothetical protein BGO39_06550 [Chloroflexi bacterium 54-19]